MITVEHEFTDTWVTILDESGDLEDVQLILDEEDVFIRQWNEDIQGYEMIFLTVDMFQDILTALNLSEGSYLREK